MDENDPIRQLLTSTGWTPEDLLKRLTQYKTSANAEPSNDENSKNESKGQEKNVNITNESTVCQTVGTEDSGNFKDKEARSQASSSHEVEEINKASDNQYGDSFEFIDINSKVNSSDSDDEQIVDNNDDVTDGLLDNEKEINVVTFAKQVEYTESKCTSPVELIEDDPLYEETYDNIFESNKEHNAEIISTQTEDSQSMSDISSSDEFIEEKNAEIISTQVEGSHSVLDGSSSSDEFINDDLGETSSFQERRIKSFDKCSVNRITDNRNDTSRCLFQNYEKINLQNPSEYVKETSELLKTSSSSIHCTDDNLHEANPLQERVINAIDKCIEETCVNSDGSNHCVFENDEEKSCVQIYSKFSSIEFIDNNIHENSNILEVNASATSKTNVYKSIKNNDEGNKRIFNDKKEVDKPISSNEIKETSVLDTQNKLNITSSSIEFIENSSDESEEGDDNINAINQSDINQTADNKDGPSDDVSKNEDKNNLKTSLKQIKNISDEIQDKLNESSSSVEFIENSDTEEPNRPSDIPPRTENVDLSLTRSSISTSVEFMGSLDRSQSKYASNLKSLEVNSELSPLSKELNTSNTSTETDNLSKKPEENYLINVTENTQKASTLLYAENGPNSATLTAICQESPPFKSGGRPQEKSVIDDIIISDIRSCVDEKLDEEKQMLPTLNEQNRNSVETISGNPNCVQPNSLSSSSSCVEIIEDLEDTNNDKLDIPKNIASTSSQIQDGIYNRDNTYSENAEIPSTVIDIDDLPYIDDDDDEDDYFEETCDRLPSFAILDTSSNGNCTPEKHVSDESNFSEESFVLRLDPDTDKENNGEENGTSKSDIETEDVLSDKSNVIKESKEKLPNDVATHEKNIFSVAATSPETTAGASSEVTAGNGEENETNISHIEIKDVLSDKSNVIQKSKEELPSDVATHEKNICSVASTSPETTAGKSSEVTAETSTMAVAGTSSDSIAGARSEAAECQNSNSKNMLTQGPGKSKEIEKENAIYTVEKKKLPITNEQTDNLNPPCEDEDYGKEEPIQSAEKIEEIRNNLKMQLSSLRTRKKTNILQDLLTKAVDDNNDVANHINVNIISSVVVPPPLVPDPPPLIKIKQKSRPVRKKIEKQKISVDTIHKNIEGTSLLKTRPSSTKNTHPVAQSPYIGDDENSNQTDSFGLVIASVQGGVEDIDSFISGSITSEPPKLLLNSTALIENEKCKNNEVQLNQLTDMENVSKGSSSSSRPDPDESKESEVPSVLKDLRQIIRKQKTNDEPAKVRSLLKEGSTSCQRDIEDFSIFNKTSNSDGIKQIEEPSIPNFLSESSLSNGESSNAAGDTKSPFISNTLDEFLTENSKLNISYKLPKLDAEKGIKSDSYSEDKLLQIKKMQEAEERLYDTQRKEEDNDVPKIKPKTLAEKRKLLEKSKIKEKRQLEKVHKKQAEQKRSYVIFNDKKIWVRSRIPGQCLAKVSNNMITSDSVVISQNASPAKENNAPEKPSLLKDLFKQRRSKIKYKPGPLSKKRLQENNENWETTVKRLPKVVLEIKPEIGKPVHPKIVHLLPENDGSITDIQIDLALSALKTEPVKTKTDQNQNLVRFVVPYENNLEKIIVRRRRRTLVVQSLQSNNVTNKVANIEEQVSQVISDLIRYVEIKELAPSLIIDCNSKKEELITPIIKPSKVSDNVSAIIKKPSARRSRIDLELSRLSCKIVNVKLDESNEIVRCENSYCQLGCVCRSLSCETFIGNHCKKVGCMFDCSCRQKPNTIYNKELKLPAGTDILSTDTVSRIEDQAKRDMAKVEREFTQTVICTDDKTIVVGVGGRSKSRRVTKVPKKYSDFFDVVNAAVEEKDMTEHKDSKLSSKCVVNLEKIDLSAVIPYCLVHSLYYCHCRGTAVYKKSCSKPISIEDYWSNKPSPKSIKRSLTHKPSEFESSTETSHDESVTREITEKQDPETTTDEVLYSETGRPLRDPNKIKKKNYSMLYERSAAKHKKVNTRVYVNSESDSSVNFDDAEPGCARSRYLIRSKRIQHSNLPDEIFSLTERDFVYNLTEADILKIRLNSKSAKSDILTESDRLKIILLSEYRRAMSSYRTSEASPSNTPKTAEPPTLESERKNKRKQTLQVRDDTEGSVKINVNESQAMQRRKKKVKVKSVFIGEIVVTDPEWLQKLEENSKQMLNGYARLLPWKYLMSGFYSNDIKVYCAIDYPYRLVFCKIGTAVPATYLDIANHGSDIVHGPLKIKTQLNNILRQCQQVKNVVSWIMSGNLPTKYIVGMLSFLLIEARKDEYEVRGLCNQIVNNNESSTSAANVNNTNEILKPETFQQSVVEVRHKDMHGKSQTLFMSRQTFDSLEIVNETEEPGNKISLSVNLPRIHRSSKWHMVLLNREFAYILLQKINYSVKYTDLDNISKYSATEKCTVILKNQEIMDAYSDQHFGMYFDPTYTDRIFIGPYPKEHTEEDVKTLRYFNKTLVNSELFNRMQGRGDYKCGLWLVEMPAQSTVPDVNIVAAATVDLTEDDDNTPTVIENSPVKRKNDDTSIIPSPKRPNLNTDSQVIQEGAVTPASGSNFDHVIYHNNLPIFIKPSQGRSPDDYNKFLITNIPGFGYLGAYKPMDAPWIEVSWPYEKKVLQFNTCDHAKEFLEYRFSQLLIPVPETFKIQVTVLDTLNISCSKPINAEFLSGYCICGAFGTMNYKTLTEPICRNVLGTTQEEVTKLFARRAQAAVRKQILELASILEFDKSNSAENFTITSVLNMAVEEIKKLESAEKQFKIEIKKKETHVITCIKKLYQMISELPNFERNMESKIFNETLKIREYKPPAENEVIEIGESDEDESVQKSTSKVPELESKISSLDNGTPGTSSSQPSVLNVLAPVKKTSPKILSLENETLGTSSSSQPSVLKVLAPVKKTSPKILPLENETPGTASSQPSVLKVLAPFRKTSPKVAKVAPFSSSKKTIIITNYKSILKQNASKLIQGIKPSPTSSLSTSNPIIPLNPEPIPRTACNPSGPSEPPTPAEENNDRTELAQTSAGSSTGTTVQFSKKSPVKILPKPAGFSNLADTVQSVTQTRNKEYRLVKVSNGTVVLMSKM